MPKLVYHDSDGIDKTLQLGTGPIVVGRAADCQIQTHDAMVSRKHARITWEGNYWIEDLGSSNGVFLGAEKVSRAAFRPGDVVTCGSLVIRMMPEARRPTPEFAKGVDSIGATRPRSSTPLETPVDPLPPQADELHPRISDEDLRVAPPAQREKPRPTPAAQSRAPVPSPLPAPLPPVAPVVDTAELQRLQAELAREAERRSQAEAALLVAEEKMQGVDAAGRELVQLRRRVEQLESELDEVAATQPPVAPPAVEASPIDLAEVGEAVAVFNDALAELKASVRAAVDEGQLLTAPEASVRIVRESMESAMGQLEGARMRLREMINKLGLRP